MTRGWVKALLWPDEEHILCCSDNKEIEKLEIDLPNATGATQVQLSASGLLRSDHLCLQVCASNKMSGSAHEVGAWEMCACGSSAVISASADGTVLLRDSHQSHLEIVCSVQCGDSDIRKPLVVLEDGEAHGLFEDVDASGISWHVVRSIANQTHDGQMLYAVGGSAGLLLVGTHSTRIGPQMLAIKCKSPIIAD